MIFSHKSKKDIGSRVSRIPYGNYVLMPYSIIPNTKKLHKELTAYLEDLVNKSPESFDSMNGDAFDNLIDNWANRAKDEVEKQRPKRAELIKNLASSRIANKKNAEDLIIKDQEYLNKINDKIKKYEDLESNDFD